MASWQVFIKMSLSSEGFKENADAAKDAIVRRGFSGEKGWS